MGLLLVVAVITVPGWIPAFPKTLSTAGSWLSVAGMFLIAALFSALGIKLMGDRLRGFIPSFAAIFVLSALCQYVSMLPPIKTAGLPKWLSPAVRSEYYIKIGLILLGTSVLFGEILKAGALGMLQAVVVVFTVWYFTFWLARKLKLDSEMGIMLASAVSICGVSAAIATCGAIKGDSKKLSFVVSIVLVVAIPMMSLMPAKWMGLTPEVAGAWLGGTIDTTGAVVAAGKFLGETAETYSVIIKSSQNVLLGIAAFAISIYWSLRGTNRTERPTAKVIWDRFPKFVVGFVIASLVFSFCMPLQEAKALGGLAKGLREVMFSLAFVCIGLETDFRFIFKKENKSNIATFFVAQGFNIVVTLVMAYLLFGLWAG